MGHPLLRLHVLKLSEEIIIGILYREMGWTVKVGSTARAGRGLLARYSGLPTLLERPFYPHPL
jgi:hypothetical protein